MKNIILIGGITLTSTSSYAAILITDGPSSVNVSGTGAQTAYASSTDSGTISLTVTGGSLTATSTDGGQARAVYTDNVASAVDISGGTVSATSTSAGGLVQLIRSSHNDDVFNISGGTFTATTTSDPLHGFFTNRDGVINFSGGIFNFSQTTSSNGAIFEATNTADGTINLSGGLFNNLDQFDKHIILGSGAVSFNISGTTFDTTGLTVVGGAIQNLTGSISGTLADGNAFDFNFSQANAGAINIAVVPEPSSTALLGLGGLALILRRRK